MARRGDALLAHLAGVLTHLTPRDMPHVPLTPARWTRRVAIPVLLMLATRAAAQSPADTARITFEPFTLTTRAHGAIDAEIGSLRVPRQHAVPDGATMTLRFVRLKARQTPTMPPVIYLAGGPGGSGIDAALGVRWPVFDAVRQRADVILLDQRGTGRSDAPPPCPRAESPVWPNDEVRSADMASRAMQREVTRCIAAWRAADVDLDAFTTIESAHDVNALRKALGVEQVSLWGMSYGTHLALAVMRAHPSRVARVVLMGTEGPDHTLKTPREGDALLERLHRWAARDREAGVFTRDLRGDLARALTRLDSAPIEVSLPGLPASAPLRLGVFDLQLTVAGLLGRTQTSGLLPVMLHGLLRGDATLFGQLALQVRQQITRVAAMSLVMDVASGASSARRALVAAQERESVLGRALNFPWADLHAEALGVPDVGDAFRAPFVSTTPALFISGTMDGRTPVANANEVRRGFRHAEHLILDEAGHDDDLWTASATVTERIAAFLAGESVRGGTLRTKMLRVPRQPTR
jgi:pimeloyl-ACP methyl ester carboxylesterase